MKQHRNLRTHTRRRKSGATVTYYLYDMRKLGGADVPLGADRSKAMALWAELDAKHPRRPTAPHQLRPRDTYDLLPTWAKAIYGRAKHRAKQSGKVFALTRGEFAFVVQRDQVCAVTGHAFELSGQRNPMAPSLDRIESKLGYIAGNVRLVTLAANVAMNSWGESALQKLLSKVVPQVDHAHS